MPLQGHELVIALLFQECAGTVYSFLKQQLLKRGSTQKPAELDLNGSTGQHDHVTADEHSTALRSSVSVVSTYLVLYP